jgi:hypothetical protein
MHEETYLLCYNDTHGTAGLSRNNQPLPISESCVLHLDLSKWRRFKLPAAMHVAGEYLPWWLSSSAVLCAIMIVIRSRKYVGGASDLSQDLSVVFV